MTNLHSAIRHVHSQWVDEYMESEKYPKGVTPKELVEIIKDHNSAHLIIVPAVFVSDSMAFNRMSEEERRQRYVIYYPSRDPPGHDPSYG